MNELEAVEHIVRQIVPIANPKLIILYGCKRSLSGAVNDADLCIVASIGNKSELEREIYLSVHSDISFDIILYTPEEWETLTADTQSFAHRILEKGIQAYER